MIPHPVIPQTPEQARQRDQRHQVAVGIQKPSPAVQLVQLQAAVRAHRDATTEATPADIELWGHLDQ